MGPDSSSPSSSPSSASTNSSLGSTTTTTLLGSLSGLSGSATLPRCLNSSSVSLKLPLTERELTRGLLQHHPQLVQSFPGTGGTPTVSPTTALLTNGLCTGVVGEPMSLPFGTLIQTCLMLPYKLIDVFPSFCWLTSLFINKKIHLFHVQLIKILIMLPMHLMLSIKCGKAFSFATSPSEWAGKVLTRVMQYAIILIIIKILKTQTKYFKIGSLMGMFTYYWCF